MLYMASMGYMTTNMIGHLRLSWCNKKSWDILEPTRVNVHEKRGTALEHQLG